MHDADREFGEFLHQHASGNYILLQQIVPLVYARLRAIARKQLARERSGHSLDSVALVNETFLNLVDQKKLLIRDRAHFLALSAKVMRRILVDHARARNAKKRGNGEQTVLLEEIQVAAPQTDENLLALDAALGRLAEVDAQAVSIVEQRYFTGATESETSQALGISPATVRRRWAFAKAWLYRELHERTDGQRRPT